MTIYVASQTKAFGAISDPALLNSVYDVHQAAYEALSPDKKHYLFLKTRAFFERVLVEPNSALIGGFDPTGKVVGVCAVRLFESPQQARAQGALSAPGESLGGHKAEIAFIQSFCIAPTVRGQAYGPGILSAACAWFNQKIGGIFPKALLCAQVAADNACARKKFEGVGLFTKAHWSQSVQGQETQRVLLAAQKSLCSPSANIA